MAEIKDNMSSHVLVRFLEDKLLYTCLKIYVKPYDEDGAVRAKYRGSYYPALILGEGDQKQMNELFLHIRNQDRLIEKYSYQQSKSPLSEPKKHKNAKTQTTLTKVIHRSSQTMMNDTTVVGKEMAKEDETNYRTADETHTDTMTIRSPLSSKRSNIFHVDSSDAVQLVDVTGGTWQETPSKQLVTDLQPHAFVTSKPVRKQLFQDEVSTDTGYNKLLMSDFDFCMLDFGNEDDAVMTDLQTCAPEVSVETLLDGGQHSNIVDDIIEQAYPYPSEEHLATENRSSKKIGGKKKYFCIFCKSLVTNFPRHIINKHSDEGEVKILCELPPNSKERKNILRDLRGKGTIFFNTSDDVNKGSLIVSRTQKKTTDPSKFKPCPKCNNYFSKGTLYKHYKKCGDGDFNDMRNLQASSSAIMIQPQLDGKGNSTMVSLVLPGMTEDSVYEVVKNDPLIIDYGNYLSTKLKLNKAHLKNSIRTRLRQVGSLLITMRDQSTDIVNLQDTFKPKYFDIFLNSVRKVAGYCNDTGTFRAPSLVTQLGNNMKTCAERLSVYCIKTENEEQKLKTAQWIELFSHEYYNVLGKPALEDAAAKKWNKPRLLPTTDDILKVNHFLKSRADIAESKLNKRFDRQSYEILSKSLEVLIMLFNRKRAGETERLLLQDYTKRQHIQKDSELYHSLSNSEKIIADTFTRVEIRGKKGRPVPILIRNNIEKKIELLLSLRKEAGIPESNRYVFGVGSSGYYQAGRALREAAWESGAARPDLITGTQLRKEIASRSQALNFTDTDMKNLADYMGHHGEVHNMFYKMPSDVVHLAKLSQLLIAIDEGRVSEFFGKSLNEINVEIDVEEEKIQEETQETSNNNETVTPQSPVTNLELPGGGSSEVALKIKSLKAKKKQSSKGVFKKTIMKQSPYKKGNKRRKWTTPERHQARKLFLENIKEGFMPTRFECKKAIDSHPEFKGRSVTQLKTWIYYESQRQKKKSRKDLSDSDT